MWLIAASVIGLYITEPSTQRSLRADKSVSLAGIYLAVLRSSDLFVLSVLSTFVNVRQTTM